MVREDNSEGFRGRIKGVRGGWEGEFGDCKGLGRIGVGLWGDLIVFYRGDGTGN